MGSVDIGPAISCPQVIRQRHRHGAHTTGNRSHYPATRTGWLITLALVRVSCCTAIPRHRPRPGPLPLPVRLGRRVGAAARTMSGCERQRVGCAGPGRGRRCGPGWSRAGCRVGVGLGAGSIIGGRVTLLLDPGALSGLAVGRRVVLVSGTNGKTTTSHLLAAALRTSGPVAHNATGSNMADGAVAALAAARDAEYAVLEVDEWHLADGGPGGAAGGGGAAEPDPGPAGPGHRGPRRRGRRRRGAGRASADPGGRQRRRPDGRLGGRRRGPGVLGGGRRRLARRYGDLPAVRQHDAHRRTCLGLRLRAGPTGTGLVAGR